MNASRRQSLKRLKFIHQNQYKKMMNHCNLIWFGLVLRVQYTENPNSIPIFGTTKKIEKFSTYLGIGQKLCWKQLILYLKLYIFRFKYSQQHCIEVNNIHVKQNYFDQVELPFCQCKPAPIPLCQNHVISNFV